MSSNRKCLTTKTARKPKVKRFFDSWGKKESDEVIHTLARLVADRCGTDTVRGILPSIDGDLPQYCSDLTFDYNCKYTLDQWRALRQLQAFYKKNLDFSRGGEQSPTRVAYEKFKECEDHCGRLNREYIDRNFTFASCESDVDFFFECQRKICEVLGDAPLLKDLHMGFGPGASSTVKEKTTARFKLNNVPSVSSQAQGSLQTLWATCPAWYHAFNGRYYVSAGELAFVPKDSQTDRPIVIEPVINTFVQKGIGRHIRSRLLKFGINLRDQSINQRLARRGSIDDSISTIDLESASENISIAAVSFLIVNQKWLDLLTSWRTGNVHSSRFRSIFRLNKFSSMGNGFTFELETLIFYSVVSTAIKEYNDAILNNKDEDGWSRIEAYLLSSEFQSHVYGDDIACPSVVAPRVIEMLTKLGFRVNSKKSFTSGPFRESCGKDYLDGRNIRPFYFKDRLTTARLVGFYNHLTREGISWPEVKEYVWSFISHIPTGPDGFGDGHIVDAFKEPQIYVKTCKFESVVGDVKVPLLDSSGNATEVDCGWNTYEFNTFIKVPLRDRTVLPIGDWLFSTYAIYDRYGLGEVDDNVVETRQESDSYAIRGGFKAKRVRVVHLPIDE